MPMTSPPRSGAASYRSTEALPPSQRMYQAVPAFAAPYMAAPPPSSRARVTVRRARGCNLVRPCALASRVTRMLLFNASSAVLSVVGALLVWTFVTVGVVTLPLCCCGVLVLQRLLQTVFYLCCTDAFVYNALAASATDCIDMDTVEWESTADRERHPLLPIRVPPPVPGGAESAFEPCPRFERTLRTSSPRSVLAAAYFGSFKLLVGAGQLLAVCLVLGVLGFLIGDSRVPIRLDAVTAKYPFAVYTTAFGLLLAALALLHGMTRVSKHVTRFFCCETVR